MFDRLKEPSTWASIAAIAAVLGPLLVGIEVWQQVVAVVVAVAAGIGGVAMKEKGTGK